MKLKKAFPMFLFPLLAACAYKMHADTFSQLTGKPFSSYAQRLGRPLETVRRNDDGFYIWIHKEMWNTYVPEQGPQISVVGENVVYPSAPTGFGQKTYTWECRLEIDVKKGSITAARDWGDAPACAYFDEKLNP